MNSSLHEMTKDMQARIRELAYLMWESAGRQHGMAMEYWLKAEYEVMSTLHAAAERMIPAGSSASKTQVAKEKPADGPTQAVAAQPEPALAAPSPTPVEPQPSTPSKAPVATEKPAPRRSPSRAKKV